MPTDLWKITGTTAQLHAADVALTGTLDLSHVEVGLRDIQLAGVALAGHELLGVNLSKSAVEGPVPLAEVYARQGDLVATFAQTPLRPMRVQLYWRAAEAVPAIDLQVSVQTNLLDSHPQLTTVSSVSACEVLRLMDAARADCEPVGLKAGVETALTPGAGTACLVFRAAGFDTSYVEMLHPGDFRGDTLLASADRPSVRLERKLFAMFLEKGVILRSRSRGLFVPRRDDTRHAAEAYAAFLATELPLTT